VRLRHAYGGAPFDVKSDCVVLVTQRLSNDGLYLELAGARDALAAAGIEAVYRTGDCVAPRWLVDTVFDGHRLAREIDGANPDVHLPVVRERGLPAR
jgi:dimethylamine/trimethylamine dehydrogenase